jgi:hypothetical protein
MNVALAKRMDEPHERSGVANSSAVVGLLGAGTGGHEG